MNKSHKAIKLFNKSYAIKLIEKGYDLELTLRDLW